MEITEQYMDISGHSFSEGMTMDTSGDVDTFTTLFALYDNFTNSTMGDLHGNHTENIYIWWVLEKAIFALDMLMVVPVCLGNILVLLAYKTTAKLQLTSNLLLVNLAFTDLFTGLIAIPWVCFVHYADVGLEMAKYPCLFSYISSHIMMAVSCITLLWMAILRFIAIVYPLKHKMWVTRRRVKIIIVCMWIYVSCLVSGFALFGNKWSEEAPVCDLSAVMPGIYVTVLAAHLMVVCVISTILYIYIGMTIVKSKVWIQQWAQPKPSVNGTTSNREKWSVCSRNTGTRSTSTGGSNSSLCVVSPSTQAQKLTTFSSQDDLRPAPLNNNNNRAIPWYKRRGSSDQINKSQASISSPQHQESNYGPRPRLGSFGDNNCRSNNLVGQKSPPQMGKRFHPQNSGRLSSPHLGRKNMPAMGVKSVEGRRASQEGATTAQDGQTNTPVKSKASVSAIMRQQICQRQESTCRMVKMLATVLGCFYACWLPSLAKVFVSKILYSKKEEPLWLNFIEQMALTILFANSFLNPVIYAGMNRTFYRVFRKLLHLEEAAPRDSSTLS